MAANTGIGVVTSRTETISPLAAFSLQGHSFSIDQKARTTVTTTHGVAMPASPEEASSSLADELIWWTVGSSTQSYLCQQCRGTKTDTAYRQIGDSNLYDKEVTLTELYIRVYVDGQLSVNWKG